MWLSVSLPDFAAGASVRVAQCHAAEGDRLECGAALVDLVIDFSAGVLRDCPPVATCRIVLQEAGWLRVLAVAAGDDVPADGLVALLATEADEAPAPASREARLTAASVLHHDDWWASGA